MPAKLSIHVPDQPAIVRVLAGPACLSLGRAADCDLVIEHASVSRRHAELQVAADGQCRIIDRDSKNGLRVAGERCREALLDRALWFALGDVFCEFQPLPEQAVQQLRDQDRLRRDSSAALTAALAGETRPELLLPAVLELMLELAECRRGFLLVAGADGALVVRHRHAIDAKEIASSAFDGSRSAVERTLRECRPVYLSAKRDAAFLNQQASVVGQGIRSLACLPLAHKGVLLGVVYLDTDEVAKVFSELDAELLEAFAARAATSLAALAIDSELCQLEAILAGVTGPGDVARRIREAALVAP